MISLPNREAIEAARSTPELAPLLSHIAGALLDLTFVLIVEPDDDDIDIIAEIGWSPLIHPIDQTRYGSSDFTPYWASLRKLGDSYELIHPVGNDGFAYILIIHDGARDLQDMCRQFASA